MARIRAFRALRPPVERAADVSAVPYDVVNSEEAAALARGNRWSFLHVSRPEIDLPAGTDLYSDAVYAKARENFDSLVAGCPLERDPEPSLYLYRLRMGDHEQTGLVACCSVDEYDEDRIKKHERTRRDKEDDRTRHLVTLGAQTGLVFLTYRGQAAIDGLVAEVTATTPLYDFLAPDGIAHTLWRIPEPDRFVEAFSNVPDLYVADGHHRSASASRARAQLRDANPGHTGEEDYNFVLAVVFPAGQLRILPYNRVVKDLNGHTKDEFLAALGERFEVAPGASPDPARGSFSMYLDGSWFGLTPPDGSVDRSDPIASLDVSVLQDRVLSPLLGVEDPRTDKRIDFVGGIRGTAELVRLVDSGKAAVAFSLHPTTLDDLMRIADAGEIMPPKSTWFEPKLRDGLVCHTIN
ncbi:MAG: DUF1015 domain-containing protein [Acidobacteria bacterium]|nr:DUF1015 domain-containing protein [Acidobacteriota bacterium]